MTLLTRLASLAPHLHPSVAKSAEWEQLMRDLRKHLGEK